MIRKTKILAVITAAAVGIGAAAMYIPAAAEETAEETVSYTYEDLTYEIRYEESGQPYAVITDCDLAATSVEVPAAIDGVLVTTIGEGAFSYCYNLQTITLPYSITAIEDGAFVSCDDLHPRFTIPENVSYIGTGAFKGCSIGLFEVPEENSYFESVDGVLYTEDMTTLVAYPSQKSDEIYAIPDTVTTIYGGAFYCSEYVLYVDIPESVTRIEESAFESSSITSAVISESVEYLGGHAFAWCDILSLTLYPVEEMEIMYTYNGPFYGCSDLEHCTYIIPDGTTEFNGVPYALDDIEEKIDNFVIPERVTSFGTGAFSGTAWLEAKRAENPLVVVNNILVDAVTASGDIVIPDGVTGMVEEAFYYNSNITSVVIPYGVTMIPCDAFNSCENLTSAYIPDSVTHIAWGAFKYCENLTDIRMSSNVVYVGSGAFYQTGHLLNQSTDVRYAGNWTIGCWPYSEELEIADGTVGLGGQSFGGCSMYSLVLPDSVRYIGQAAFYDCSNLKQIYIPTSVNEIGTDAFCDSGLTDVYYGGDALDWLMITRRGATYDGITVELEYMDEVLDNAVIHFNASPSDMPEIVPDEPDEPEIVPGNGDVNFDGQLTEADAVLVEEHYSALGSGSEGLLSYEQLAAADVNGDGTVDIGDASLIREMAGITTTTTSATTTTTTTTTTTASSTTTTNTTTTSPTIATTTSTSASTTFTTTTYITTNSTTTSASAAASTVSSDTTDEPDAMRGNIDGNDTVDITDASISLEIYARKAAEISIDEYTDTQKKAADVDGNGCIDLSDAAAILTYYAFKAAGLNPTWEEILAL